MRSPIKILTFLLVVFLPATATFAQRETIDLPDGWKFIKHDVPPDAPVSAEWENVAVPHCWNALDGQNGKAADPGLPEGYYRGPAWYARTLDVPTAWQKRRVFIRFEAALPHATQAQIEADLADEHYFKDSKAAFLNGILGEAHIGTCSSLPVLYAGGGPKAGLSAQARAG